MWFLKTVTLVVGYVGLNPSLFINTPIKSIAVLYIDYYTVMWIF